MLKWIRKQEAKLEAAVNDEGETKRLVREMNEPRPLPMGVQEFHEWSDRIISGALVSADVLGQKFALADMIMHLGPTKSHCEDAYFIQCLRKAAANQVAHAMFQELKKQVTERNELKVVPAAPTHVGEAKIIQ